MLKCIDLTTQKKPFSVDSKEGPYRFFSPSFIEYPRGPVWYTLASFVVLLAALLGLALGAPLAVFAGLIAAGLYVFIHHAPATIHEVSITKHAITVGQETIPHADIASFWIMWEPPTACQLRLTLKKGYHKDRTIHIFNQNPELLRTLLSASY